MTEDTHRAALQPGQAIQWYEIRRILGQGGFGITYLAHDRNLDQAVAIKEYLPLELAVRDVDETVQPVSGKQGEQYRWGLERFLAEARTLAQFKHPNIVRVFSVFEANNTAYMVMEYERGESLQARLSGRGTLDETELLRVLLPLLDGLQQVHAAGFIHRDIKPPNIFIREDGSPVLLDFGSARQATGEQTRTLTALVSPGYAPFEQYHSGVEEQGPWTDIYGLAATMYRAVSGNPPTDAVDRSRTILDTNRDFLVTAAEIGRGVYSERLLRAIDHGLAFRQKDRPRDITEWRADLGIEDHLDTVRRIEALEEALTVPAAPRTPPVEDGAATKGVRGGGRLLAAGIGLAAAAAAGLWWFVASPDGDAPIPDAGPRTDVAATPAPSARAQPAPATAPPPGAPANAGPQRDAGIQSLLERAAAQREAGRIVSPAGDNALASYRAVLELDPGNEPAGSAIRGIYTEFLAAADAAIDAGDLEAARTGIGYAALIDPDGTQLGITRIRLADAERQARERVAATERERQAAAERERQAAAERERVAAAERESQAAAERERVAAAERESQAAAERERVAAAERERQAAAERERVAATERERQAAAERLAAAERENQAAAERERVAAVERERLASLEQQRLATAERERQAATERERLAVAAREHRAALEQCRSERERLPPEPRRAGETARYFAAIAVGDGYAWGEAFGFESRGEAEGVALANCRDNAGNCAVQVWTNDCIAFARGVEGAAGWAWGPTVREAAAGALKSCETHDPCCRLARSYCADELVR